MADIIHQFKMLPDSGVFLMARVLVWATTTAATKSDILSIAYTVHDMLTGVEDVSDTLVVDDVFYDSLQTDSRWTAGGTGYNFGWLAPEANVPKGGRKYQVLVELTMTAGPKQIVPYVIDTERLYGKA